MKNTKSDPEKNGGLSDEIVVRMAYDNSRARYHWSIEAAEEIRQADMGRFVDLMNRARAFSERCQARLTPDRRKSDLFFGAFKGLDGQEVLIFRTYQHEHPDMLSDWWFTNSCGVEFDVRDLGAYTHNGIIVDHLAYCDAQIRKAVKIGQITDEKVSRHARV